MMTIEADSKSKDSKLNCGVSESMLFLPMQKHRQGITKNTDFDLSSKIYCQENNRRDMSSFLRAQEDSSDDPRFWGMIKKTIKQMKPNQ